MLILFSLIINSVFYYCIYCIILLQRLRLSFVLIKRVYKGQQLFCCFTEQKYYH